MPRLMRLLLVLCAALGTAPLLAQSQEQIDYLRRNPTAVRERLQASGLTPAQVRERLTQAGYPATLLDQYLDASGGELPEPGALTVSALRALAIPFAEAAGVLQVDSGLLINRSDSPRSRVFGVDVFRRSTTQFLPLLSGPVPPNYVVGPGDVLVLILTGEVEASYTLPVTREGFIIVPQVGQLFVANLSLERLRDQLFARLSRAYSGIRNGPGATTQFDVSVANVRANQVYVVGEVTQPGAYQISALGTLLTALYAAGGVTADANLRVIELRRADSVIARFDLYDYLLEGRTGNDLRLETGDVVFVGTRGPRVAVAGAVLRPAIYEIREGEGLADVLDAAGGFNPGAMVERLTVHRILPGAEQGAGPVVRAALSVPLIPGVDREVAVPAFALLDGDSIEVHPLPPLSETYYVAIGGMVRAPGRFPWRDGMTLRDLLELAQGPRVGADLREAEIARLPAERTDGDLADQFRVTLDSSYLSLRPGSTPPAGPPGPGLLPAGSTPAVPLRPYDQVLIFRQPGFEYQRTVHILGEVTFPGEYALLRKDDRISDLVVRAGGLQATAYRGGARLIRPSGNAGRVNIELDRALTEPGSFHDPILQPGDSLIVPEFIATVRVTGAVHSPTSVLYRQGAGFDYYIENAGGFARDADQGRVSVRYANGEARSPSRFLFWRSFPTPDPGSTIFVPSEPEGQPFDVTSFLGNVAQILASTVAIIVVATRL